ncbi:hypothetical protein PHYBOEH_010907 [Phytophthora boehmeriae]|uniref:Uncharacterized protein n=1 Tax=Phytophthora boehmeriae TaxID=109152 RepID=A0A8T1X3C9_9STRA|nr:hypothetical protein PHYBOEH_010907 [Phytophthora boehmeriae]
MTSIRKSPGLRLQTSIVQDNIPVELAAGLFIGSIHAAFNVDALKASKITHVLNLAGSYATFPDDFTYLSLSIRDKDTVESSFIALVVVPDHQQSQWLT